MIYANGIAQKYIDSIEQAFETILRVGNDFHRQMISDIIASEMLIKVEPVSKINASGVTGLIDSSATEALVDDGIVGRREALGQVYISIANETIDTGGQRGCEGTFVHEGRHAWDFAEMIVSRSEAAINPLSIFDPTLYELELAAHITAGEYMLLRGETEFIDEGLDLQILCRNEDNSCSVSNDGILGRLRDSYGLELGGNQGRLTSELLGLA